MALSNEDKKDVKNAYGKALANRVSKVTDDSRWNAIHKKIGATKSSWTPEKHETAKSKALRGKSK